MKLSTLILLIAAAVAGVLLYLRFAKKPAAKPAPFSNEITNELNADWQAFTGGTSF